MHKMCSYVFILIILAISASFASEVPDGEQNCGSDQWLCNNGDCISTTKLCDGKLDCSDKSDETKSLCRKRVARNSGDGVCVLPPHPENGVYEVKGIKDAQPGQSHPSFVLTVYCRRGFGVEGYDGSGFRVFCVQGTWLSPMPECVRFCKLYPDPSIRYTCDVPGVGTVPCKEYISPGVSVQPECNSPIYGSNERKKRMICERGVWYNFAECKAECGRISPGGKPLLTDGKVVKRGELPWHTGIHRKIKDRNDASFEQICGGSIVANNIVISAAHCFFKNDNILYEFGVTAGKLYRAWDGEEDFDIQKSLVKEIKTEALYGGVLSNFQEDIAVLILVTPFNYTAYIRPVCLDYRSYFESNQLRTGNYGKVAGWGLTAANGPPSNILKVLRLPFIDEYTCKTTLPEGFFEYITGDKFCAGYTNGTAVCQGDSGGGLAFPYPEYGVDRYYLRGVVSTAPPEEGKECNDFVYTTFTKITKHDRLIDDAFTEHERKICPFSTFHCDDGSCVELGADCNGKKDCPDGSDESEELCHFGRPATVTTTTETPLRPRPPDQVRTCVLPPYPDHGTYKVRNPPGAKPGQFVEHFALTVSCSPGYNLLDPDSDTDGNGTQTVLCLGGIMYQDMPQCYRFCRLDPDPSVHYMCEILGTNRFRICKNSVAPGNIVNPICNSPNYYSPGVLRYMKCIDGSWDYVARCQAECGRVTPEGVPLVIGGEPAKRGELPWHVGIYRKTKNPYQMICGGSIVSNKVVLSAAHCFWSDLTKLQPASRFAVAAGKIYQSWDDERDVDAQKSDVKQIIIPNFFQGSATNFQEDIAVVTLVTPFVYHTYLRPVCLNFDANFERRQLQHNNLGKVAGWGLTSQNGNSSAILNVVKMPFIDITKCIRSLPISFREYITSDKICGGYTNGTALCMGDTGGGWVFPDQELGVVRYYLRGFPSTAPTDENNLCNVDAYTLYTQITKHQALIQEFL